MPKSLVLIQKKEAIVYPEQILIPSRIISNIMQEIQEYIHLRYDFCENIVKLKKLSRIVNISELSTNSSWKVE